MGQEPNHEIPLDDLPRASAQPAPARRWQATRPGDLHAPSEVPWGGAFGTPGPDTGYARKLAGAADLPLEAGESRHNVESVLVIIMGARASMFGKAPSADDLGFATMLLGLETNEEIPGTVMARLAAHRRHWAPRVANSKSAARSLATRLTPDLLSLSREELRHRLALGEAPLTP